MTPWQNRVTELTRRMADDMKLRNFSQSTIDAYRITSAGLPSFLARRRWKQPPKTYDRFNST